MSFSIRLKQARKAAGKSQRLVAEALNVSVQAVSQWENGQVEIQPERVEKLAKTLNVEVKWLLEGTSQDKGISSFPKHLSNQSDYGNRKINVYDIEDLAKLYASYDEKSQTVVASMVKDVIYVKKDAYKNPFAVRIKSDDFKPDLNDGDLAVFDVGDRVTPGEIAAVLISTSGVFHMSASEDNEADFVSAIIRLVPFEENSKPQMMFGENVPELPENARPALMVLGPLVERRTVLRRSSGST